MKSLAELRSIAMSDGMEGIAPEHVAQLGLKTDEQIAEDAGVSVVTVSRVRELLQIEPWDAPLPWENIPAKRARRPRPIARLPSWGSLALLSPPNFYLELARTHDANHPDDPFSYRWLSETTGYSVEEIRQGIDGELDDDMRIALYLAVQKRQPE